MLTWKAVVSPTFVDSVTESPRCRRLAMLAKAICYCGVVTRGFGDVFIFQFRGILILIGEIVQCI